jgi:hypothetical protein
LNTPGPAMPQQSGSRAGVKLGTQGLTQKSWRMSAISRSPPTTNGPMQNNNFTQFHNSAHLPLTDERKQKMLARQHTFGASAGGTSREYGRSSSGIREIAHQESMPLYAAQNQQHFTATGDPYHRNPQVEMHSFHAPGLSNRSRSGQFASPFAAPSTQTGFRSTSSQPSHQHQSHFQQASLPHSPQQQGLLRTPAASPSSQQRRDGSLESQRRMQLQQMHFNSTGPNSGASPPSQSCAANEDDFAPTPFHPNSERNNRFQAQNVPHGSLPGPQANGQSPRSGQVGHRPPSANHPYYQQQHRR